MVWTVAGPGTTTLDLVPTLATPADPSCPHATCSLQRTEGTARYEMSAMGLAVAGLAVAPVEGERLRVGLLVAAPACTAAMPVQMCETGPGDGERM